MEEGSVWLNWVEMEDGSNCPEPVGEEERRQKREKRWKQKIQDGRGKIEGKENTRPPAEVPWR
jgi:hypothetical protein